MLSNGAKGKIAGVAVLFYEALRPHKVPANPDYPVVYHGRHLENDWTYPVTLEKAVLVNFWGTVLAAQPIPPSTPEGFIEVSSIELEDGTFLEPWSEEDERDLMIEQLDNATKVRTSDGYVLIRQPDGSWSDGDLTFTDDEALLDEDLECEVLSYDFADQVVAVQQGPI